MIKLTTYIKEISLAPKEKSIYMFVENSNTSGIAVNALFCREKIAAESPTRRRCFKFNIQRRSAL